MSKQLSLLVVFTCIAASAFCQPLFTYGTKAVTKQEFLTAFNKNPSPNEERRKALNEYLNLYINYKLKVQAGYDDKLNNLESFQIESKNYKRQIAENIINEQAGIKTLVQQAFQRSQKDVHTAHVFIEVATGADTTKAWQQIQQAYKELSAGKNFSEVAATFSSDEATKSTKGDLGFITVFTLQYAIENEIYALSEGQFSKPYRSGIGYHIFKNLGERPAAGKRKAAQVLIAIPQGATVAEKAVYQKKADSVYQLIVQGMPFEQAAANFSNDMQSANNGGLLNEIAVGQYQPAFESHLLALQKTGSISQPFETNFGIHILKLLEIISVNKDTNNLVAMGNLRQQIERDNRITVFKKSLLKNWMTLTGYKKATINQPELWLFTDSAVNGKSTKGFKNIKDSSVLFSFEKQKVYVADWVRFARSTRFQGKSNEEMMKEFTGIQCTEYYTNHLEAYNKNMQQQLKEFDEANLLFAAMDKHVWNRAGEDTTGLKNYYQQHLAKYQWAPGVSALVFTCNDKQVANEIAAKIKANPSTWRSFVTGENNNHIIADSGRYELQQLPIKQAIESKVGFITTPEKNSNDESYLFVYVTAVHPQKETRNFDDARGMVINEYQQVLEQQWLAALKAKYRVKVNDAVWKTVK